MAVARTLVAHSKNIGWTNSDTLQEILTNFARTLGEQSKKFWGTWWTLHGVHSSGQSAKNICEHCTCIVRTSGEHCTCTARTSGEQFNEHLHWWSASPPSHPRHSQPPHIPYQNNLRCWHCWHYMLLLISTISSPNPVIISVFLCEHDWPRTAKYTNTNMQILKHKYANTNTQIQIQICKYKNTNTQIREWVLWYKAIHIRGRSCHSMCRERRQAQSLEASPCLVTSKCKWQWWGLTNWW